MRLLSFSTPERPDPRVGVLAEAPCSDYVIDAKRMYEAFLRGAMHRSMSRRLARALIPDDMCELLAGGADTARALHAAVAFATDRMADEHGLASLRNAGCLHMSAEIALHPPVPRPGKILAVGSNYAPPDSPPASEHAGAERRPPLIFAKLPSTLLAHDGDVAVPAGTSDLDCEGELAVVIGRRCERVGPDAAQACVAGYTIINDLSLRAVIAAERNRGSILFGKNFAGSSPCGPVIVTSDETGDPRESWPVQTWVNGQLWLSGSTADMVHSPAELVSICSQVPLEPGDLIATGAPKRPTTEDAIYLKTGDQVTVQIGQIGELRTNITATSTG